MDQTTRAIIDASTSPLSIVIVGVGGADFSNMEFLDSDDELLAIEGRKAARDIVQFVPYRKFAAGQGDNVAAARLAREVLAEIPEQLVSYFNSKGIQPPRALQAQPVQLGSSRAMAVSPSHIGPVMTGPSAPW